MEDAGVAIQVVSHNPGAGVLPLEIRRQANEQLYADGTSRPQTRLAGFVTVPMASPVQAAEELSRCVKSLEVCWSTHQQSC